MNDGNQEKRPSREEGPKQKIRASEEIDLRSKQWQSDLG